MATTQGTGFGELQFGQARLGDERRRKGLVRLADRIAQHPEGTLPDKLQDPAAYQAMYRLCKHPNVTHEAVFETHRQLTLRKMSECGGTVLVLHDTTELDYTSHDSLKEQLGPIGDGRGRGYECHHSLAVVAETGDVLGLASQILHRRAEPPENEGVAASREREDRESLLWLKGSQAVGPVPEGCCGIDVCDRGADTFEFLDYEDGEEKQYVVRSSHNRAVFVGHEDQSQRTLLHDYLRTVAPQGGRLISVPARDGQPARHAKCLMGAAPVQIVPPHVKRGHHRGKPLYVWAIRVWEIDPPPEMSEPLEWFLLTNVPTRDLAEIVERVSWYERRWTVEDYPKAQKTGCGMERLQFQHTDRLQPMIALLSVVAVMLLELRMASRHKGAAEALATTLVPASHVMVLSIWRHQQPRSHWTVLEFCWALARLGGHQNRRGDGPPGWITLWRGWNKLNEMVQFATAAGLQRSD